MLSDTGSSAVRNEPTGSVVVAIRNDLLRYGVERMLHAQGVPDVRSVPGLPGARKFVGSGGQILITLFTEIDDTVTADLRIAAELGVKIMLLLEDGHLTELSKLTGMRGIRWDGFLTIDHLTEGALYETLSRMDRGEVPMAADLARNLLALAGQKAEASKARPRITPREQEALVLMVEGMGNKQIARRLHISEHGAKRLVSNILAKLDCTNRTLAVAKALQEGLYKPDA